MNRAETVVGLLRGLAAITDEGLIVLDRDDRVLLAPGAACELLGVAVTEGDAFHSSQIDYRVLRVAQAARGARRLEQRDINIADRELVVRALAVDDDRVATIVRVRDGTRLRRLVLVRRDVVRNVSHELRPPVTAVRPLAAALETGV